MKKIVLLSLIASSMLMAGGYKIPETSTNGVALSAANVAHNKSADAAYYNPANMVFMNHNGMMETNLMYIGLSSIDFRGAGAMTGANISSEDENFLVPSFHYVSPEVNGARYGLSVVAPAGLSKRWKSQPAKSSAQEFTLETVEINPSIALPIGDKIGIAIGIRAIYSSGVVKSNTDTGTFRDMEGDTIDFGYNLAISYKPTKELELALTYRSNIDLKTEGHADLSYTGNLGGSVPLNTYSSSSSAALSVPVPALFNAAIAYTFTSDTTLEFVYERNYWHTYNELDFNYGSNSVDPIANVVFGTPLARDWKDTNTFRLGITQELDKLTLMAGFVIDETPAPDSTVDFALPDSDSVSYSVGARYQVTDKMNIGLAALYSDRKERAVNNLDLTTGHGVNGKFDDSSVLLVSAGLEYRF
jgi:long-chain fatty acid transport protein